MKSKKSATLELVTQCSRVLDDKKAGDLKVLDVAAQSSITDYLIVATATSEPHLRALRVELEKTLDAAKAKVVGMDLAPGSGWVVIDAFDVMIHLFLAETRQHYGLERLWRDASEVSVKSLLTSDSKPAKGAKPAKARKAPAAKKRSTK
jgi:ribosome-associated protein